MKPRIRAACCLMLAASATQGSVASELHQVIRYGQQRVVKIYGAGGRRQMEAYQTGLIVSPEGHVLTALSYVLDTDEVAVVLDDGRRYEATWVGSDPMLELAVLKLPAEEQKLPYFDLENRVALDVGDRVLALSNLYGIATGNEPVSALHGIVSAVAPLQASRGRFQANYRGPVYVVDAHANNPGAAGGALVDWQGRLAGVLGKELRSSLTGAWLHYALPVETVADAVEAILAGREQTDSDFQLPAPEEPLRLTDLGLSLVPDLLPRTPPFVDAVARNSTAAAAGLLPDDLIVFVVGEPIASCRDLHNAIGKHERSDSVRMSVLRDGKLLEFMLNASETSEQPDRPKSTIEIIEGQPE